MAQTLKRNPYELKGSTTNYSKYYTQTNFTGIKHIQNPFEVDQMSFKNAKNVYIDDDQTLVSRLPLLSQPLPMGYIVEGIDTIDTPVVANGYTLVDKVSTGKITVYVTKNKTTEQYRLVAMNEISKELQFAPNLITKYHIAPIEKYIIVFNNVDAIVLNTDKFTEGWKYLREAAEVPITKRIVGQQTFIQDGNQFTSSYKEEYIWSEDIASILPDGTAEATVNQSPENLVWTLEDANVNTEFRILRSMNINLNASDLISVATNKNTGITVVCVAKSDHVMISVDEGLSFERVLYPVNSGFLNIASISKDALNFFFVASDGVYRYSIADKTWTVIELIAEADDVKEVLNGNGYNNVCCFNNAEVFSFILWYETDGQVVGDLYCKGPGLKTPDYKINSLGYIKLINLGNPLSQNDQTRKDLAPFSILVKVINEITNVVMWTQASNSTSLIVYVLGQNDTNCKWKHFIVPNKYGSIDDFSILTNRFNSTYEFEGIQIKGITSQDNIWETVLITVGKENRPNGDNTEYTWTDVQEFKYLQDLDISVTNYGAPIDLDSAYIVNTTIHSVDGVADLPSKLNNKNWLEGKDRTFTISNGHYYYIVINNVLYTNKMLTDSNASITYTYNTTTPYTDVPNVSYVNNELYLGFDSTLKITANIRNGTDLIFNLPKINNQAFTSNITGIINISTTEVAIFLIDQIYIVMQIADETFGYRYEYYNTRLSTGIRVGDMVINTKDGVYTLYPTLQGLAIMNYQAEMASTDQIVEYVTKDIIDIWTKFYNAGNISIIQMRDYVYLTNGTNEYLMLDLRNMSWWQFEIPIAIQKLVTDQVNLEVISNGLYRFEKDYTKYRDFNTKFINWQIESQPLHFNLPTYYKNMKQLVFQFEESTNIQQTINAQIKLYRKKISYKDPETIAFKVDGYRTFIKRFNYWKINELQWGLGTDFDTNLPARLKLNCISIKYEQGEEVRS